MLVSVSRCIVIVSSLAEPRLLKGGSFLYVATVLQPVSSNHTGGLSHEDDISVKTRLVFIVLGMFAPLLLSSLVGHGHS